MTNNYKLIKGTESEEYKSLKDTLKKYPLYAGVIRSIVGNIKRNSLQAAELTVLIGKNEIRLSFSNPQGAGTIKFSIKDGIASGKTVGVPYIANWNGYFYRLPHLKKKPYVKNGQVVKKGAPIGVVFVNKNEQFILSAPDNGRIYFPDADKLLEQGALLEKNKTILFHLDV